MGVEYCCIVSMMEYRPRCPLALECNKIVEREVRGNMVVNLGTYIPTRVGFH